MGAQHPFRYLELGDVREPACTKCMDLARQDLIRSETVMPVPLLGAPLDVEGNPCCRDCQAAETMQRLRLHPDFVACRIAIGNDHQRDIRLPEGMRQHFGLIAQRVMHPAKGDGAMERHHAWLDHAFPDWMECGRG